MIQNSFFRVHCRLYMGSAWIGSLLNVLTAQKVRIALFRHFHRENRQLPGKQNGKYLLMTNIRENLLILMLMRFWYVQVLVVERRLL